MTTALFYANPRPLQTDADADLKLRALPNFEFARNVNSIPINMIEFPLVARHYPITFVGPDATPMAIVGLQTDNLFLDAEGRWKEGYYIPAFVRRYPFIFAKGGGANEYSLCVDDLPDVVGDEGSPLFEDGQPTALTRHALAFCKQFQEQTVETNAFSKDIRESGLLVDQQADARLSTGQLYSLNGFRSIDPARLRKVHTQTLGRWNRRNFLSPIFVHLQSMTNWNDLINLMPAATTN